MQIVLDFGSGNTCKNDKRIVKRMIDSLCKVDKGTHDVVIKWQLFERAGDNIPLKPEIFRYAYEYAKKKGYKTTASVFSTTSLRWLINEFDVPFVKIPNRRDLYYLAGEVPKHIPVYISYDNKAYLPPLMEHDVKLYCISKYPAKKEDYSRPFYSVSDHTPGFGLFPSVSPHNHIVWEKHYALKGQTGLDVESGVCITPEELKEIL